MKNIFETQHDTHTVLEAMLFTPNNIASLSLTLSVFESLPLGTMDNESIFFFVSKKVVVKIFV